MKHKFEITISSRVSTKLHPNPTQKIKGFTSLNDACATAEAIKSVRPGQSDIVIAVWLAKRKSTHNICLTTTSTNRTTSYSETLLLAEQALKKAQVKQKAEADREKFIKQYAQANHLHMVEGQQQAYQFLLENEVARNAWLNNDFPATKKYLDERFATPATPATATANTQ